METTRRRPRSPVLGGCTLNYYQIRAKSHLLTGLSVTALSPAAVFGSSPKYIHRGPQPFAVTQTCWSLATRTGTVIWPWRSCALLSRCPGSMLLQRKDTKGGHVSLQRQFFVSPFLLRSGNVYQLCAPPAPKSCPKPKAKQLATPKCTTTIQEFHKGLLTSSKWLWCCQKLSTSGFGSETIPNMWKKFSVSKNKEKTQCRRFCLSAVYVEQLKPSPQWAAPSTRNNDLALLHHVNKGLLLQEPLHLHGHSKCRKGTDLWSINSVTPETTTEGSLGWQFSKHLFKQCFHHSSRWKAKSEVRNSIQAKLRISNTPNTKHLGWWRYLNIISISIIKLLMIFLQLTASFPQSLLHQHPTQSQQPPPKPQASVFRAVLKCTIWHYWATTNPPKVFYNKWGCNFLAVAAATKWLEEIQQHYVLVCTQKPPNIFCGCQGSSIASHEEKTSLTILRPQ